MVALAVALALITMASVVGHEMNRRGLPILLPRPPLLAFWHPHLGWGTPLAVLCVLLGLRLQKVADGMPWRLLLLTGWLLNLAWMCSLTLVDGLQRGWIDILLNPNEYLHDLHANLRPGCIHVELHPIHRFQPRSRRSYGVDNPCRRPSTSGNADLLAARPGRAGRRILGRGTVHTRRLGGQCRATAVTIHEFGAGTAARRIVPFVALFPGAVWMAVSADGLFAGVAVSGLALVSIGAARGRILASLMGGLLLGAAVFLSYGLLLFGLVVLLALLLTVRQSGLRQVVGHG